MFDKTEKIGNSIIQHGPNNDRIYLMKLKDTDLGTVIHSLNQLSLSKRYTKIIAKVPESAKPFFEANGFKVEAFIPCFYNNSENGYFLAKYLNSKRHHQSEEKKKLIHSVKNLALSTSQNTPLPLGEAFTIRQLTEADIPDLSTVYKKVFDVYPFPVFKESYLHQTMLQDVIYFGAFKGNSLVAVSSVEMDLESKNAEMTDFATLNKYRGKNLSLFLLKKMTDVLKTKPINTLYTIARAKSFGMNKTFGRDGYKFGGTLINNTQIGNSIESMNIWYKQI